MTAPRKKPASSARKTAAKAAAKPAPRLPAKSAARTAGKAAAPRKSATATKVAKASPRKADASSARPSRSKTAKRAVAKASTTKKLAVYRSKRDFGRTPEPSGEKTREITWKKAGNPFFVIQKHAASRLHYDFRLEVDGVLKSWAVPKGPSMNPGDKRLAVEVEDHPVDYADFEGVIPENEYGGGTVIVWDAGPYRNLKERGGREVPLGECHQRGQIEIWLEGKKVRGGFALVHSRMGDSEKNWLLIKMKDRAADREEDPVQTQTRSVLSGRTLEEVAEHPARIWSSR